MNLILLLMKFNLFFSDMLTSGMSFHVRAVAANRLVVIVGRWACPPTAQVELPFWSSNGSKMAYLRA